MEPIDKWWEREQLHFAAEAGDLEEVKRLLEGGSQINAFSEGLDWTPLHHAAMKDQIEVVRYLLEAGADVNAHEEQHIGNTVLRDVAETCSYAMAKLLIDAGADPSIPGWMQLTALDKIHERVTLNESRKHKKLKSEEERKEAKEVYKLLLKTARKLHPGWQRLVDFTDIK